MAPQKRSWTTSWFNYVQLLSGSFWLNSYNFLDPCIQSRKIKPHSCEFQVTPFQFGLQPFSTTLQLPHCKSKWPPSVRLQDTPSTPNMRYETKATTCCRRSGHTTLGATWQILRQSRCNFTTSSPAYLLWNIPGPFQILGNNLHPRAPVLHQHKCLGPVGTGQDRLALPSSRHTPKQVTSNSHSTGLLGAPANQTLKPAKVRNQTHRATATTKPTPIYHTISMKLTGTILQTETATALPRRSPCCHLMPIRTFYIRPEDRSQKTRQWLKVFKAAASKDTIYLRSPNMQRRNLSNTLPLDPSVIICLRYTNLPISNFNIHANKETTELGGSVTHGHSAKSPSCSRRWT